MAWASDAIARASVVFPEPALPAMKWRVAIEGGS
jgi:hypothetical protein